MRRSTISKEERFENRQWNDAVREAKRGYKQVSDFDWKVEEGEPTRAASHLRKALGDFNSALTHIAKAEVGVDQKGAVDDMNHGVKELNDAVSSEQYERAARIRDDLQSLEQKIEVEKD